MTQNKKPNRLIEQTSPYLLQHAYNPVDWYPWGIDQWMRALSSDYSPNRMILAIPGFISDLPGALAEYKPGDEQVLAYVCRDRACLQPVSTLEQLRETLAEQIKIPRDNQ